MGEVRPPGMPEWRRWAWGLLLVGGGVSIAVNLGHAFLRPTGAGPEWAPGRWAIAWGVVVPTLLFFAVKGITVIPWPRGFRWMVWRFCGATPVAGLAGYVSWDHISALLNSIGESQTVCLLAPLAVDGLMFIGVGGLMIPLTARLNPGSAQPVATARAGASAAELGREYLTGRAPVPAGMAEELARTARTNGGRR